MEIDDQISNNICIGLGGLELSPLLNKHRNQCSEERIPKPKFWFLNSAPAKLNRIFDYELCLGFYRSQSFYNSFWLLLKGNHNLVMFKNSIENYFTFCGLYLRGSAVNVVQSPENFSRNATRSETSFDVFTCIYKGLLLQICKNKKKYTSIFETIQHSIG